MQHRQAAHHLREGEREGVVVVYSQSVVLQAQAATGSLGWQAQSCEQCKPRPLQKHMAARMASKRQGPTAPHLLQRLVGRGLAQPRVLQHVCW